MIAARKGLFVALCVALVAAAAAAGTCTGEKTLSEVPYTVSATTTGDDATTTLLMTVCSTVCEASEETCQPLKSMSVGATGVITDPASGTDDCGVVFDSTALASLTLPPTIKQCEAFYLTADTPNATLNDICGGECQVAFEMENGVTAAGTIGGGDVPTPASSPVPEPTISPAPTPYRRRRLSAVEREMAGGVRSMLQYRRRV